jgi:uncharacterized protein
MTTMKPFIATFAIVLSLAPLAVCQQPIDGATKEDVEQMLQVMGTRERILQMWSAMAQQVATTAADAYQQKHPNATPLEIRKAAEIAGQSAQNSIKVFSVDELIDAIIPIYQKHLTHSEIRSTIDFYQSPTGQKMLAQMPAMMSESMQAMRPIMQKHLPELEAQAEKAAETETPAPAPAK